MLKELLEMVFSNSPGGVAQLAVISYPGIVALYDEDIVDAADYLGVFALKGLHFYQPREIVAAYAGHGMGLCDSYKDKDKDKEEYREEGLSMPARYTLLVEYTVGALCCRQRICEKRST